MQTMKIWNNSTLHSLLLLFCIGMIVEDSFSLGSSTVNAQEWLLSPPPISQRTVEPTTVTPGDVLSRMQLLGAVLESIRQEMGKPKDIPRARVAMNAHPHEVYFQALTLYLKADRLALELTGSTGLQPMNVPAEEIRPYHTWLVVNAAFHRLVTVKAELQILETFKERSSPGTTTPTDVGRAIVQANRQLNLMLEHRVSPSEVYQQVEAARQYAERLLKGFRKAEKTASLPPFQRRKTPNDVFLQLIRCFEQLETFAKISGISILHLDGAAARKVAAESPIQPGNVYDLATLILSDLAYIHGKKYPEHSLPSVPFPGTKLPSHVFQLARGLGEQLDRLVKEAQTNPSWVSP